MKLITEIKIYQAANNGIFKVTVKHSGKIASGGGSTINDAYKGAENQLAVKPGLVINET